MHISVCRLMQNKMQMLHCTITSAYVFASKVQLNQSKKSIGPTFAWLSHTQRHNYTRAASADAPSWMQTSAHHHRIIRIADSANSTFVPNPTAGSSSRPIMTPELAQKVSSISAAIKPHSNHRGRKHICERTAKKGYVADYAKHSGTVAHPPPRKCAEAQSAGTIALLRGEPSQHTPAWFVHRSLV